MSTDKKVIVRIVQTRGGLDHGLIRFVTVDKSMNHETIITRAKFALANSNTSISGRTKKLRDNPDWEALRRDFLGAHVEDFSIITHSYPRVHNGDRTIVRSLNAHALRMCYRDIVGYDRDFYKELDSFDVSQKSSMLDKCAIVRVEWTDELNLSWMKDTPLFVYNRPIMATNDYMHYPVVAMPDKFLAVKAKSPLLRPFDYKDMDALIEQTNS